MREVPRADLKMIEHLKLVSLLAAQKRGKERP